MNDTQSTTNHAPNVSPPRRAVNKTRNPTAKIVDAALGYAETRLGQSVQHFAKVDKTWLKADIAVNILRRLDRIGVLVQTMRAMIRTEFPEPAPPTNGNVGNAGVPQNSRS